MLDQAERIQRQFFQPGRPGSQRPSWEPPVDIYENATELWVLVALPGVDPRAMNVELDGALLTVAGVRTPPAAFRSSLVHRLEIPHGRFERCVQLPPGGYELSQQRHTQGCLFVHLRKTE